MTWYWWRSIVVAGTAPVILGCARSVSPLVRRSASVVALTGGPNTSMVYLARAGERVIAIDLGWWGSRRAVTAALRELDASPERVTDVFLTHSHRDHIGAWRLLRRSRFHLADAERPLLFGDRPHGGWIPRLAERIRPSGLPRPGDLDVDAFSRDTTFVFGRDTLFAFLVPGHTAGSTVYLFRGVLFLGDAATHTPWGGFGPARRGYSDDAAAGAVNLRTLWLRLPRDGVRYVCTAHGHCARYSAAFMKDVGG